jgi:hypothetical protein
MSGTIPCDSSAFITPMWANPRAAPPPKARPILICRGGLGGAGVDAVGDTTTGCTVDDESGAVVWHATKAMLTAASCKNNKEMGFIYNVFFCGHTGKYKTIWCRIISRIIRPLSVYPGCSKKTRV